MNQDLDNLTEKENEEEEEDDDVFHRANGDDSSINDNLDHASSDGGAG